MILNQKSKTKSIENDLNVRQKGNQCHPKRVWFCRPITRQKRSADRTYDTIFLFAIPLEKITTHRKHYRHRKH